MSRMLTSMYRTQAMKSLRERLGTIRLLSKEGPAREMPPSNVKSDELDWEKTWMSVVSCAKSEAGKRFLGECRAMQEIEEIEEHFDMIGELRALRVRNKMKDFDDSFTFTSIADVEDILLRVSTAGVVEVEELQTLRTTARTLRQLNDRMKSEEVSWLCPTVVRVWSQRGGKAVPAQVIKVLNQNLKSDGRLDLSRYPEARALQENYLRLEETVRTTTNLQRKLHPLVQEMESAKQAYLQAIHQILRLISRDISPHARDVLDALEASAVLDGLCARERAALRMGASRPLVGREGLIQLHACQHPLLALRETSPVGNDLLLDSSKRGLVVTGPNGGGKTILLKTVGLFAKLVQRGCWLPCRAGSRFDLFEHILCSIGDGQDVFKDLSTFSSQLEDIRKIMNTSLSSAPASSLILLDEPCSGTCPEEGSALAKAILQELVEQDVRLVTTTHYEGVKNMAMNNHRFQVCNMYWNGSSPSFRAFFGFPGHSRALAAAERSGLPRAVLGRARSLLAGHQQVLELVEEVEERRAGEHQVQLEISALRLRIHQLEASMDQWEERIATGSTALIRQARTAVLLQLQVAEAAVEEAKQEALRKEELAWGLESEDLELSLSLFYQGAEESEAKDKRKGSRK
uniref:DNA mismatch repair proteins mutS family domain-containing protein n=1 Tax=Guillardia theta TaxID=55529 RepID=A0A7S4H883_GUITH